MMSGDSTGETPRLKLLSLVPNAGAQKILDHKRMEALATDVAGEFRAHAHKLSTLRPTIERIKDYFRTNVRGSVTLAGCGSFKEYCEKKLGRTEQAVYAMLGSYSQKRKEKKQRMPKGEREHDDDLPREAVTRMRTALNAVQRFAVARTKDEKDAAWREYERIAEAEPLKSAIAGDQPNWRVLLVDMLALMDRNNAMLERIIQSGLIEGDQKLLEAAKSCAVGTNRVCSAVRKRLNIAAPA